MKSRAPQLHLEYRFYRQLGQAGMKFYLFIARDKVLYVPPTRGVGVWENSPPSADSRRAFVSFLQKYVHKYW